MEKKKSLAGSLISMIISFATIMLMLFPVIEIDGGLKISFIDYVTVGNLPIKIVAFLSMLVILYAFVHSLLTLVSYKLRVSKYAKIGWEILTLAGWLIIMPLVLIVIDIFVGKSSNNGLAMWVIIALMLSINIFASIFFGTFEKYKTYERKIVNKKLAITSLVLMLLSVVAIFLMFMVGVNDFQGTLAETIILIALTIFVVIFLALYLSRYHFSYNVVLLVFNICSLIMSIITLLDLSWREYYDYNYRGEVIGSTPAGANFVASLIIVIPFIINLVMSIIMLVKAKKIKGNEPTK